MTPPTGVLHKPPADLTKFYVVTPISNSVRYKRRYELYWKFKEMCESAGVKLVTVEVAFGDRPFMVTERDHPMHVQLRSPEEAWFKENMINIGISHIMQLDPEAKYIAWVDADCAPAGLPREWFEETWHQLQHYEFVQMWESLIDLGPNNEPLGPPQWSFMKAYTENGFEFPVRKYLARATTKNTFKRPTEYAASVGAPGLAWAASTAALNKVGRLIDFCILGSGDWHMALGLVGAMGEVTQKIEAAALPSYYKALLHWQRLCERHIKRDVGYVPYTVYHYFHGSKRLRFYGSRNEILIKNKYQPAIDVKYDSQGLIQIERYTSRQRKLYDQIRAYFRSRNEDSIDI